MNITISVLKMTMEAAKATNKPESIIAKKSSKERDISIALTYSPFYDAKADIYPYWKVEMVEEEQFKNVLFGGRIKDLPEIKSLYNAFINQGNESYLLNNATIY